MKAVAMGLIGVTELMVPVQAAREGQHATLPAWSKAQKACDGQHKVGAPRLAHAVPEEGHGLLALLFWRMCRRAWSRVGVGVEKGMLLFGDETVDVVVDVTVWARRKERNLSRMAPLIIWLWL